MHVGKLMPWEGGGNKGLLQYDLEEIFCGIQEQEPWSHLKVLSFHQVAHHGDTVRLSNLLPCCSRIVGACPPCSQSTVIGLQEDPLYSPEICGPFLVSALMLRAAMTLATSCFCQQIILLPRKPLSLSCPSCPSHGITSTTTSILGPSRSSEFSGGQTQKRESLANE